MAALKALRTVLVSHIERSSSSQKFVRQDGPDGTKLLEEQEQESNGTAHKDGCSIDQDMFEQVITGIARLGVEKLEPVRAAAAYAWSGLRQGGAGSVWTWEGERAYALPGVDEMNEAT